MASPQDELDVLRAQVAWLTARVHKLEQKAGVEPAPLSPAAPPPFPPVRPPAATTPPVQLPSAPPVVTPARPAPTAGPRSSQPEALEQQIGRLWLNRIGIVAILGGVAYFIKLAFDNNWIGPAGRIAIGLVAGIAVIVWSEVFRRKKQIVFSWSLKAVGIGTLYLSLWGAFQVYHLIPASAAFLAMIVVTGSTIALALSQDAEILAAFAIAGGFSTPVLLSTGENHEVVLFSYVLVLDLAILVLSVLRPWRRLLWGSFVGTCILYVGWYADYYSDEQRGVTILFLSLFAAVFTVVPVISPHLQSRISAGPSVTLTFLPLINAGAWFLALFAMYESEKVTLTWYALALAAVYLGLSSAIRGRADAHAAGTATISLLHVAIAVVFITIAIPLKLNAHWITLGWLVESGVLLYVGSRSRTDLLRIFAAFTLSLGIVRLLFWDNFHPDTLLFNARFATYLVAIAVLAGIVWSARGSASENQKLFSGIASVTLNLLALRALTLEASGYFLRGVANPYLNAAAYRQSQLGKDFSFSAIWLLYGAALMVVGFRRNSAFVRWQALILIAFTIGKVFIYDVSVLEQGYRVLSLIALGIVLMGISYAYHRDWLKLSARGSGAPGSASA